MNRLSTAKRWQWLRRWWTAFGAEIDYAVLQKIYGSEPNPEKRYSPAVCLGCKVENITGDPNPKHISTS